MVEVNDHLPVYTAEQILTEFPAEQQAHKPPVSLAGRIILPVDEPVTCAQEFLNHRFQTDGIVCLHYYRGGCYGWTGTHYAEIDEQEVRSALYAFLRDALTISRRDGCVPFKPTSAKVNSILDALKAGVYQSRDKNAPFFVGPLQTRNADGLIACRNGLLDISTRKLETHSPYLFNVNCLPFDYDPEAPAPTEWRRFLTQLWPDDADATKTLQQMFGLMLTADTRHQKIFLIVGPKRSGKGTIGRVLTAMLGKDNVANPTLSSLNGEFGLAPLIDKRVAIISDARMGPQTTTVSERLLSISGEDALTVNRKYRDHWTGRLGIRFLILSNELPRIPDASGALPSRFVVLTLKESFLGREDLELTEKLQAELPGILNWSLQGLDQLSHARRFNMPASSLESIRQLEDLASPVGAFVRDWCETGTDKSCNVKTLYDAYVTWCQLEGHKGGSNIMFGRNLRAVMPQLSYRNIGPKRSYVGVGLSEDGKGQYGAAKSCL
jgi:putative DNA primase/helicase